MILGNLNRQTDRDLKRLLQDIYRSPKSTASNFAKTQHAMMAVAASEGLIGVKDPKEGYSRYWRVTAKGMRFLEDRRKT